MYGIHYKRYNQAKRFEINVKLIYVTAVAQKAEERRVL